MQWNWKHEVGNTELRAEYWWGKQTASAGSSETPPALLNEPYYVRKFNGAFFYMLHHIAAQHQLGIKYDWYDPNTEISGEDIGKPDSGTNPADIKFSTLSLGYNYYINPNLKLMLWYDIIKNENTGLADYTGDVKDNLFTARLQFRF